MTPAQRDEVTAILEQVDVLTLATLREDGYPQATTVNYASEELNIYFGTAGDSQKAHNIACNDKVSFTVTLPSTDWGTIRGLSGGGRAERLTSTAEIEYARRLLLDKFPQGVAEYGSEALEGITLIRIRPEVVSLLDYRKGMGHREIITV